MGNTSVHQLKKRAIEHCVPGSRFLLFAVLQNFGVSSLTPGTPEDFFDNVLKPGGTSSVLLWLSGNLDA